jgi:opacity protein-like surface antigen
MRSIKVLAGAVALLASVQTVQAQTQMSVEVRGGLGIATGDWNEEDLLEEGYGLGFDVRAQITPQMGVYAGYEMVVFGIDEEALVGVPVDDVEAEATDAGFRVGVELNVPLASAPSVTPFVQAGIIYNSLEISASGPGGSDEAESDESLGFEAGVGLTVQVGPRLDVVPSVRFRQHEIEFEGEGGEDAQYVLISVGLRFRL